MLGIGTRTLREISSLGLVHDALPMEDDAIVTTNDGILAKVSLSDGSIIWRVTLPNQENATAMATNGDSIFVLTSLAGNSQSGVIRQFTASKGEIAWEFFLPRVSSNSIGSNDLYFDARANALSVLHRGALYVVTGVGRSPELLTLSDSKFTSQLSSSSGVAAVSCELDGNGVCKAISTVAIDASARSLRSSQSFSLDNCFAPYLGVLPHKSSVYCWDVSVDQGVTTVAFRDSHGAVVKTSINTDKKPSMKSLMLPNDQPALLLCLSRFQCGHVTAKEAGNQWQLAIDLEVNAVFPRMPVWSHQINAGNGHLSSLQYAVVNGHEGKDLSLDASAELSAELSRSAVFALNKGRLLVATDGGLLLPVSAGKNGHFLVETEGSWMRDESLSRVRHAFVLSTSPSLAAEVEAQGPAAHNDWKAKIVSILGVESQAQHQHGMAVFVSHNR